MVNQRQPKQPEIAAAEAASTDPAQTHFGYTTVAEQDKAALVRGVFDSVAESYDVMNDLMSGGIHRLWKSTMIQWLDPRPGMAFIDVGGGTGDIAFRLVERLSNHPASQTRATPTPVVCDINPEMLRVGRDRALDRGHIDDLHWVCGDAENLPFPDASFDAYTIAFCIRNVTHIDRVLREARRVLRPGGRFLCLEFSKVALPPLARLYDTYSFSVLPRLGQWVAKDPDSYRYLAESIRRFPDQQQFATMIAEAGLSQVRHRNLSGGIAALHSAWRV